MRDNIEIIRLQKEFDERLLYKAKEMNENKPIYDGILSPQDYVGTKKKILFIAKEPNDDSGGWDFKYPKEPFKNDHFWFPLKYIAYGILNEGVAWSEIPVVTTNNDVNEVLKKVAYINVNKFPAGSTTDMAKLKLRFDLFTDILQEQLEIINPDIIICLGTFEIIGSSLVDDTYKTIDKKYRKAYFNQHRIVLDCYHVGYTYGGRGMDWEVYCEEAINAVRDCEKMLASI